MVGVALGVYPLRVWGLGEWKPFGLRWIFDKRIGIRNSRASGRSPSRTFLSLKLTVFESKERGGRRASF